MPPSPPKPKELPSEDKQSSYEKIIKKIPRKTSKPLREDDIGQDKMDNLSYLRYYMGGFEDIVFYLVHQLANYHYFI